MDNFSNEIQTILERYKPYLSTLDYERLVATSTEQANPAIRINRIKRTDIAADISGWTKRYDWKVNILPFCDHAWQLQHFETPPGQTMEHRLGYYYVQDASSILPVSLFDTPNLNCLTLDMAASPGGKTTQLADTTRDRNLIVANDSSTNRLQALKIVTQTWGLANLGITNYPGEKFGDWFPNLFDRVLLDAPCSMESLRISESHPHRPITINERERLAVRQSKLLESAVKAARVGGEVIYSTCTMAPEENEQVVDWLLKNYPNAIEIEMIDKFDLHAPGLLGFEGQEFSPMLRNSLRIWPHLYGTNGFFAVKLRKTSLIQTNDSTNPPTRAFQKTGFSALTESESHAIHTTMQDAYGFDLIASMQSLNLGLMKRGTDIVFMPVEYLKTFSTLPYYALGMTAGKQIGKRFEPSINLINRFGDQFTGNYWVMPLELVKQWMQGTDIRNTNIEGCKLGTIVAVRDEIGRNLGAGKNLQNRLRNLLPNRSILFT